MMHKKLILSKYKQFIQFNTEQPDFKMGRKTEQPFSKEEMQMSNRHERILNIANHQEVQQNASQCAETPTRHNHNEISPHTFQNGYHL